MSEKRPQGFLDNNLVLSDAQSLYSASGVSDRESTNNVRLPEARLNDGNPIYLHVQIAAACAARDSAGNLVVRLRDAADDGSGAPDTFGNTAVVTQTLTAGQLTVVGLEVLRVALPSDTRAWVQAYYDAQTMSAGTVYAWLSDH